MRESFAAVTLIADAVMSVSVPRIAASTWVAMRLATPTPAPAAATPTKPPAMAADPAKTTPVITCRLCADTVTDPPERRIVVFSITAPIMP